MPFSPVEALPATTPAWLGLMVVAIAAGLVGFAFWETLTSGRLFLAAGNSATAGAAVAFPWLRSRGEIRFGPRALSAFVLGLAFVVVAAWALLELGFDFGQSSGFVGVGLWALTTLVVAAWALLELGYVALLLALARADAGHQQAGSRFPRFGLHASLAVMLVAVATVTVLGTFGLRFALALAAVTAVAVACPVLCVSLWVRGTRRTR